MQRDSIGKNDDREGLGRRKGKSDFELVGCRKNRVASPFTKADESFSEEAVAAGVLDGFSRLHFVDRLQRVDAGTGSGTAAGDRRDAHP